MIEVNEAYNALTDSGIDLFTGVPDSLLKNFCAYITDKAQSNHIIAANEGNAVGIAAGHYLATGKPALVYMQNSGLGNAINPLLSLVDEKVYSIPMVLMIGWRGEPGVHDEPQHVKQGEVTLTLLDAMQIPYVILTEVSQIPQQVALADARKGINMYQNDKVNVPVLGLVENMSWFTPATHPEEKYFLFGKEGVKELAEKMDLPLLGQIPIVQDICESGDNGTPAALDPSSITGQAFLQLAAKVVTQTDKRNLEQAPTTIVNIKK